MNYVMVLPVKFYKIDENRAACESAFVEHLKILRGQISEKCDLIRIIAPTMSEEEYRANGNYLAEITVSDGVHFTPAYPAECSRLQFVGKWFWIVLRSLWKEVRDAELVHSGPTVDFFKPFEILSIVMAVVRRKKSIFVVDIDERESGRMAYQTGRLSQKSYLLKKYLYDPYVSLQLRFASRFCSLSLLKSQALVDTYGRGRESVKNFLDTAHDISAVIDDVELDRKLSDWNDRLQKDIKLVYFGRLVAYKGIADMISVVSEIKTRHAKGKVSLSVIGSGEQLPELKRLTKDLGLEENVDFQGPITYGEELFKEVYDCDFLLAAPLGEDTPRNAFDAMASGVPIVAYDTYYYRDLVSTGAVAAVPWRDISAMAEEIISLSCDDVRYSSMVRSAVSFAKDNTQEIWMDKRRGWLEAVLSK